MRICHTNGTAQILFANCLPSRSNRKSTGSSKARRLSGKMPCHVASMLCTLAFCSRAVCGEILSIHGSHPLRSVAICGPKPHPGPLSGPSGALATARGWTRRLIIWVRTSSASPKWLRRWSLRRRAGSGSSEWELGAQTKGPPKHPGVASDRRIGRSPAKVRARLEPFLTQRRGPLLLVLPRLGS